MSHWYYKDGTPCHTMPTKKGAKNADRPTTIADARKLGLLPSVSTITSVLSAPGLEGYKLRELAKQCYLNPAHPGEDMAGYVNAMLEKGKEDGAGAADIGTQIHACLEAHFTKQPIPQEYVTINGTDWQIDTFISPVERILNELGVQICGAEAVLVNANEGYAGTSDLPCHVRGVPSIGDYKTKRTKPGEKVVPSETHPCQIAAYNMAKWGTLLHGFNIYISTTEPGRVELVEYSEKELDSAWSAFLNMRNLWEWQNDYSPSKNEHS